MRPRVLIIEQGGRGGVADYTAALVAALTAEGTDVVLATATDHLYGELDGARIRAVFPYLRGGTPLRSVARALRLHLLYNGLGFLLAYVRLLGEARRAGVVHVQGFDRAPLVVIAFALMRGAGVPLVHTPHNTFERGRGGRLSMSFMARLPQRIILHARADIAALPRTTQAKALVIEHGEYGTLAALGGAADRAIARRDLGLPADATVALVFGQLRPDKGVGDVLRAARAVPGLHVVLAGEDAGALGQQATLIADPSLVGRVTIRKGFQSMEQAAALFAAVDVAVMAYPQASASGVLLLAYGFSRAVVVYPVGGLAEAVVDGQTGWVCSRADAPALADALREVVAAGPEECLRRGAAGHAYSEEHHAWDAIARRTQEVYDEVRRGGMLS